MSRRSVVRSGSTVDAEVANLFKLQNKSQFTNTLAVLRNRYRDEDLVNKIQDVFMQKHTSIVNSAKKFAIAVRNKYANQSVPFHQLLMKARAHAKKHHLTEEEFAEFQRIYEQELAGLGSNEVVVPMTNMMKVLGDITSGAEAYFNTNEADYRNLQEILKLHDMSRPLHAQVLLQAIQYDGIDEYIKNSKFDKDMNNPADHVHPVIAALFLPKFKTVDEHFLFSNMSGIIKSRYNRQPLTTRPDYELFYNLITDPNDVVCDTRTPVADLLHRCNLQNQLWNAVLHLRNGKIYNQSLREFTASVDICRLNKYDNPDFVYGRHDGTIIKRLFSAFSFRPTVVATLPVLSINSYNPYSQNIRPTVTSIPMINIRLSKFAVNLKESEKANDIPSSLTQLNKFIEGNAIIERYTKVMYSKEIIVFYIDRRANAFMTSNTIINMARLPTSVAGYESINDEEIIVPEYIVSEGTRFVLASSVVSDIHNLGTDNMNYVIGSKAMIFIGNAIQKATTLVYSPGNVITRNSDSPFEPPSPLSNTQIDAIKSSLIEEMKEEYKNMPAEKKVGVTEQAFLLLEENQKIIKIALDREIEKTIPEKMLNKHAMILIYRNTKYETGKEHITHF